MSVFIRLSNESGFFVDPETGFSLSSDQEKPLPDNMGKRTRDWLSGGGLVKFNREKPTTSSAKVEGESDQTQPTKEPQPNTEEWDRRFEGLSVSDLRKICKNLGVTYSPRQDKAALIKRILDFEAKAEQ